MTDLSPVERLEIAKAEVARLEIIIAAGGCEHGHTWKFVGGANAGCDDWCHCSIPVYECSVCGDCDYGKNEEAGDIRKNCTERDPGHD